MPSGEVSATGGSAATQAVEADAHRWATRRGTSVAIRIVAVVVPFAASLLVARMLQDAMGSAHTLFGHVVRWTIVIIGSTTVLVTADRVTRHLLPIAALFKVALVFPDKAPSRYKVALRSGSSASLARQVRAGGELGSTPAEAAANALILLKDLGNHDRLTRGHSERVRAYSEIIAEEMDLPEADREKLRWAALIHDVGKMAVAPEILNKPGRPTDEEWEQLRQHPAAAARIAGSARAVAGRVDRRRHRAPRALRRQGLPERVAGRRDIAGGADRRGRRRLRLHDLGPLVQEGAAAGAGSLRALARTPAPSSIPPWCGRS